MDQTCAYQRRVQNMSPCRAKAGPSSYCPRHHSQVKDWITCNSVLQNKHKGELFGKNIELKYDPKRRDQVLGQVSIRPSSIPNAGDGVFAEALFLPGDVITYYSGWKVKSARDHSVQPDGWNYALTTPEGIIIGEKNTRNPLHVGSLANDSRGSRSLPNASFGYFELWPGLEKSIEAKKHRQVWLEQKSKRPKHVFAYLYATRRINPGQEILINYGTRYWSDKSDTGKTK